MRSVCNHISRCPAATAPERLAARAVVQHPEQGWTLLCNGIVVFEDGGLLLPSGAAVPPPVFPAGSRAA
jgi:hypothetical protein